MDSVNKTLFIPLYGKAYVSGKGIILDDPWAEKIWAAKGFQLRGKSRSKWLAYYMGMRAAVFDDWVKRQCREKPDAVVLHIGCGLDSRAMRTGVKNEWFDVDFPEVIARRGDFFPETERYRLLGADVRQEGWLEDLPPADAAIVVMEGVSMYLTRQELTGFLRRLGGRYGGVMLLMDCYSELAARASRYKNPINDVGVTEVHGLDDPTALTGGTGFRFVQEREMTPTHLTEQLKGMERRLFRSLYGGAFAAKLYRLYEFKSEKKKP